MLFILGLKGLTAPDKARNGMRLAAAGMLAAVIGTLLNHEIVSFTWIIIGLVLGGAIGAAISIWMPMTAVPQRTAISHAFGALAATLVGIGVPNIRFAGCTRCSRGPTWPHWASR